MASQKVRFGKYAELTFDQLVKTDPEYFILLREKEIFKQYNKRELSRYNRLYNTYIATKKELTQNKVCAAIPTKALNDAIDLFYKWVDNDYFEKYLKEHHNLSSLQIKRAKEKAHGIYLREIELEKTNIVSLHINRYEDMYNELLYKDFSEVLPKFKRQAEIANKVEMLQVLHAKEKLVGVHNKNFKIKLNNHYQQRKLLETPEIDFRKLTVSERIELLSLYEKCKRKDEIKFDLTQKREDIIEDVTFEDVNILEDTLKNATIKEIDNQQDTSKPLNLEELKKLFQTK